MARSRNIKPGFFKNELLVQLPPLTRLLFIGLWTIADREGRLEDRPMKIKMELFPCDDCDVNAMLDELASGDDPFIYRYSSQKNPGKQFIQVANWAKHQRPHHKESESDIPCMEPKDVPRCVQAPTKASTSRSDTLNSDTLNLIPDSLIPDTRETPNGVFPETSEDARSGTPHDPIVLEFPCDGNPKRWTLRESHVNRYRELYPTLDIESECRSALAWVEAKPSRKKTAGGMKSFLTGWLNRTQNRGGPNRSINGYDAPTVTQSTYA